MKIQYRLKIFFAKTGHRKLAVVLLLAIILALGAGVGAAVAKEATYEPHYADPPKAPSEAKNVAPTSLPPQGDFVDSIIIAISTVLTWITGLALRLVMFVLQFLIQIASYNDYLNATAVQIGWVLVRDVANMFFVIILLAIAFGTILGIEQYEWKKMIGKFVLAAILVNFSHLICGLIIDVAQVFTITFVNGIAAAAGGNVINAFKLDGVMSFAEATGYQRINSTEVFIAALGGLIFSVLALAVMIGYMVILLARMLVLWVLIVLSPLAFVFNVLPQTQKYAGQWWQQFTSNVIVAPVAVFFLWLCFATVGEGDINAEIAQNNPGAMDITQVNEDGNELPSVGILSIMDWGSLGSFVIALGMLLVGIKVTLEIGAVGSGALQKSVDMAKGAMKGVAKWGAMNMPLIGGNAWIRKGAWAKEYALRGGEIWNKSLLAKNVGMLQFGYHEKVMANRKRSIEARKGDMLSSVKGGIRGFEKDKEGKWKAIRSVDLLKSHVNQLEGAREIKKERSELKRSNERKKTQWDLIISVDDKGQKHLTEFGEHYIERVMAGEKAGMDLDSAKTAGKINYLNTAAGGKFIESQHDYLENQKAFTEIRRGLLSEHEISQAKTERIAIEAATEGVAVPQAVTEFNERRGQMDAVDAVKQMITAKQDEVKGKQARLEQLKQQFAEAENVDKLQGVTREKNKLAFYDQHYGGLDQTTADKVNAKRREWAKENNVGDDYKVGSEDYKKQTAEAMREVMLADLPEEIKNTEGAITAGQTELKALQDVWKKSSKGDPETYKMVELLEKIASAKDDIKRNSIISSATNQGGPLSGVDAAFFAKQSNANLSKLADGMKNQEKYKDNENYMKDEDTQNNYKKALGDLSAAKQAAFANLAKDHINQPSVAAAYYKARADSMEPLKNKETGLLNERAFQESVASARGIRLPGEAGLASVAQVQKNFASFERDDLVRYMKTMMNKIVEGKNRAGYADSTEAGIDKLWLNGLMAEMQKQRYVDDITGSEGQVVLKELGINDDEDKNKFIQDWNKIRKTQLAHRVGAGGQMDPFAALNRAKNSGQMKHVVKIVNDVGLDINSGRMLGADDINKINMAVGQYFKRNPGLQLNQAEVSEMLKQAMGDENTMFKNTLKGELEQIK